MCGSEMVTKYPTNGLESHWNLLEGWIRSGSSGKSSEGFEFRQAGWIYPPPCASGAGAIMRQQARADSSAFPRQDLQSLTFLYPHLWGGGDDDGVEVPRSSSVIHPRERGAAWHVALAEMLSWLTVPFSATVASSTEVLLCCCAWAKWSPSLQQPLCRFPHVPLNTRERPRIYFNHSWRSCERNAGFTTWCRVKPARSIMLQRNLFISAAHWLNFPSLFYLACLQKFATPKHGNKGLPSVSFYGNTLFPLQTSSPLAL